MGNGMLSHLDTDVSPSHLVRHRRRGAGAEEGIENEVVGVGGKLKDFKGQSGSTFLLFLRRE